MNQRDSRTRIYKAIAAGGLMLLFLAAVYFVVNSNAQVNQLIRQGAADRRAADVRAERSADDREQLLAQVSNLATQVEKLQRQNQRLKQVLVEAGLDPKSAAKSGAVRRSTPSQSEQASTPSSGQQGTTSNPPPSSGVAGGTATPQPSPASPSPSPEPPSTMPTKAPPLACVLGLCVGLP